MQAVPLTRNNDFRRLYKRGKSLVDRNIVVYYAKNRLGANRVGFTVGKKVGGAVTRNRAKRLMRESFRLLEPGLAQGFDFVFVSRSRLPHLTPRSPACWAAPACCTRGNLRDSRSDAGPHPGLSEVYFTAFPALLPLHAHLLGVCR